MKIKVIDKSETLYAEWIISKRPFKPIYMRLCGWLTEEEM